MVPLWERLERRKETRWLYTITMTTPVFENRRHAAIPRSRPMMPDRPRTRIARNRPGYKGRGQSVGGAMGDVPRSTLVRIRRVILSVPRGHVITYGQAAARAGFPGAPRLTVWALRGDASLPWHRVVAAGGRIALPGEDGREQRLRLEMEGVQFYGTRVRMDRYGWAPRSLRAKTRRRTRGRSTPPSRSPASSPPRLASPTMRRRVNSG